FAFGAADEREAVRGERALVEAVLIRERYDLQGALMVEAEPVEEGLWRVTVTVENTAAMPDAVDATRDRALRYALASTHAVLTVEGGSFVSMIDPPVRWSEAAAHCRQEGCWPVLVGDPGQSDTVLASPIIL